MFSILIGADSSKLWRNVSRWWFYVNAAFRWLDFLQQLSWYDSVNDTRWEKKTNCSWIWFDLQMSFNSLVFSIALLVQLCGYCLVGQLVLNRVGRMCVTRNTHAIEIIMFYSAVERHLLRHLFERMVQLAEASRDGTESGNISQVHTNPERNEGIWFGRVLVRDTDDGNLFFFVSRVTQVEPLITRCSLFGRLYVDVENCVIVCAVLIEFHRVDGSMVKHSSWEELIKACDMCTNRIKFSWNKSNLFEPSYPSPRRYEAFCRITLSSFLIGLNNKCYSTILLFLNLKFTLIIGKTTIRSHWKRLCSQLIQVRISWITRMFQNGKMLVLCSVLFIKRGYDGWAPRDNETLPNFLKIKSLSDIRGGLFVHASHLWLN